MMNKAFKLIDKLEKKHSLKKSEYKYLIKNFTDEVLNYSAKKALSAKKKIYGDDIYIRGLIEISNICKKDCLYCGIRKSNKNCERYRLTAEEILECADMGYSLGFRTFVLQGGEDPYFTDEVLVNIIKNIKQKYPDTAITLSLGERSKESYEKLFSAGADRYLLRHETANKKHYSKLHPKNTKLKTRMKCLKDLKNIGFQVGAGFMVGSPYQTPSHIASDLKFIEKFSPDMCGVGPFIPHHATVFNNHPAGDLKLTLFLISLIRLIKPNILLPATTALGSIAPNGREQGILSGANVVMPNLSPEKNRKKYELYTGKLATGLESAEGKAELEKAFEKIGQKIVAHKGDIKK